VLLLTVSHGFIPVNVAETNRDHTQTITQLMASALSMEVLRNITSWKIAVKNAMTVVKTSTRGAPLPARDT